MLPEPALKRFKIQGIQIRVHTVYGHFDACQVCIYSPYTFFIRCGLSLDSDLFVRRALTLTVSQKLYTKHFKYNTIMAPLTDLPFFGNKKIRILVSGRRRYEGIQNTLQIIVPRSETTPYKQTHTHTTVYCGENKEETEGEQTSSSDVGVTDVRASRASRKPAIFTWLRMWPKTHHGHWQASKAANSYNRPLLTVHTHGYQVGPRQRAKHCPRT